MGEEPIGYVNAFRQLVGVREPLTKEVASAYPGSSSLSNQGPTGGRAGRFQPKQSVWTLLVELLDVDPEDLLQCPRPRINSQGIRRECSAATVPRKALALSTGTAVTSTSAPSARNMSSNPRQSFASRSRMRNRIRRRCSSTRNWRLRACWMARAALGLGRHPGQIHSPSVQFDEEQDVQPP